MDRNNRDARRSTTASTTITPPSSNGLTRRRHRTSLRDSPEDDDGRLELPDTLRNGLRDRHVGGKKDRGERIDRLDRLDRDRDRDRMLRNKRRRGDVNNHRSIHHGGSGNRGDELGMVADESSEESVNDNEEDDELQHMSLLHPSSAVPSSASALLNHNRSYPPSGPVMGSVTAAPKVARPVWKVADEMIGVSVPRKARSVSTKRSHDCWVGGGVTASHASGASGDQAPRQPSTSPVRPGLVAVSHVNNRPASPSSSNASARKKLKPNGPKQRPPKSVSIPVSSSATQDEIEIAEVLYGMMRQPQGPDESMKMEFSRDENSKPLPVSNSGSILPPQNFYSSVPPMSAVAPKRKKPRQIKYDEVIRAQSMYPVRNIPISAKLEMDSNEVSLLNEKRRGSGIENDGSYEQGKQQGIPVLLENSSKMEGLLGSSKKEESTVGDAKELPSPKKESGILQTGGDVCADGKTESKRNPADSEAENHREEKYQIDLMASPSARSSPEREFVGDFAAGLDQKFIASNEVAEESEKKAVKAVAGGVNAEDEGVKREVEGEGSKSGAVVGGEKEKGVRVDLQLDVERGDGGGGGGIIMMMGNPSAHANPSAVSKGNQPGPKQQPLPDKSASTAGSLTFPISVSGWPGGLPPLGYMPPLTGVVSTDGSAVAPATLQSPQLLFSQPRSKRCATHCYIARNISYHQQMARIPFWPTAAAATGSVSLYGAKPGNVNMMPLADPNGNASTRNVSALPEKGQNLGLFPGHSGKDKASPVTNNLESQRKPILLQQAIPPGAPGNILHGPAFIFPLSQQQAVAAAASCRSGPSKSTNVSGGPSAPSTAVGSASSSSSATAAATTAAAMSFSHPNMPGGETQYLAILQNNSYSFPVPAHMGAVPPAYRGTHPQALPFINGPFYSSQVLHPSQLQQQVLANVPQMQQGQGHHNTSKLSGSSTSLKHLQSHQQRSIDSVGNGYGGSLLGVPSGKNQPSQQTLALQQQINQHPPHQVRPLESEAAGEDYPSTSDSRIPRANMTTIYEQNFTMPMHTTNFTLMTQALAAGANGDNSNNPSEKHHQLHSQSKSQSTPQHQGSKQSAIESLHSPAFAMSFTNMGSSASTHTLDISSFAQSHAVLQSLPEATRQTYQIMAAAAAAAAQNAQQKNVRVSDDDKVGGNDTSTDNDRKPLNGKSSAPAGHSIAFSRPDFMDSSVSSLPCSSVIDSSIRTLNLGSGSSRATASVMPTLVGTNFSTSPQQLQRSQQQMIQLQKQHQFSATAATAARNKTPVTNNGSVYSDHLTISTSAAAKYPSALSSFPHQSSSGQTQSQWRGSTRPTTSSMPSSLAPATVTSSSLKLLSQQPVRVQQGQTHISFGNSNSKSGSASQGLQQIPASNQQSPPPVVVGSPTTSSVSKSTGGSPRTTSSSTGNKPVQAASPLQMQQAKNSSQLLPTNKSASGNGNAPSIIGNSLVMGAKHQLPQQQLSKQTLQQAQLFFSHPYVQVQAPHSSTHSASTVSATSPYYMQRRPSEQQSKLQQHSQVTVNNMKGGNLQPTQGILHAAQFAIAQTSGGSHQIVPAGFNYVHAVPNAVQLKPADQKQPAGE